MFFCQFANKTNFIKQSIRLLRFDTNNDRVNEANVDDDDHQCSSLNKQKVELFFFYWTQVDTVFNGK